MINLNLKLALIFFFMTAFFACGKKAQPVPAYTVSKVFKTDTLTTVNVHIASRMNANQLLAIAGKVKRDSTQLQNLKVVYLLPGNADITSGENSYYASAKFIKQNEITGADTLKDEADNVVRLKIYGLSAAKVKHMLTLNPKEIVGKKLMGKFIDDYNHTVIIPFTDPADAKKEVYIIEVDSAAKVVSATVPDRVKEGNTEKWLVTQHGDYMVLKDSVLSQYAADGLGVPFNSIKAGI